MPDFSRCAFSEGSVSLPAGYSDRTVNVLLAEDDFSPSLNISRDMLQPDEALAGYITRQLDELSQGLKGWVLKNREPAVLGKTQLQGECVHASYLRDGKRVWQRQAVFALQEGHVLVFTLAHTRKLLPQDDALLQQVLDSYQPA
ncbi:DcrB-related protein [Serratia bockelmannii]|uniref:DcrB-related protein n=1 Tax=Serratia bockelmannii TaxID=2703793 RepID=UPI003FA77740